MFGTVGEQVSPRQWLEARLESRTSRIGVVGLGYVGLPLVRTIARAGFRVAGFDIDREKIDLVNAGYSYIDAVASEELASLVSQGLVVASTDQRLLAECDVVCLCVPTPLTRQREPDLSFVVATAEAVGRSLRRGQLVVLESTTYPGTTEGVVKPILDASGLTSETDYFLAYSPEREDPGNRNFETSSIPKVVAGEGPAAQALALKFYASIVSETVSVSNIRTAEVVKITENVFRSVNIGLVNELKCIYDEMDIDIWEVIDAARTKPFGFMPFYPGPGLGGHCIPVDPFYLTWKSREFHVPTRFIELSGEINQEMPRRVLQKLERALDVRLGLPMSRSTIVVIGLAYKKNVADTRESPSLKIIEMLRTRAADVAYHDPFVQMVTLTRNHPELSGMRSVNLSADSLSAYDAVVILTDHDDIDYKLIGAHSRLIVDTRNAMSSRGFASEKVVKA